MPTSIASCSGSTTEAIAAAALRAVVREEGALLIFGAESGSRAWGHPSPDSDWDVRFVYARPLRWHTAMNRGRDVIERALPGDLDVAGWELRKALALLIKGNCALREWLASPIRYAEHPLAAEVAALAAALPMRRAAHGHYLSLIREVVGRHIGLDRKTVNLKRYLYAVRPALVLRWLRRDGGGVPPMDVPALLAAHPLEGPESAEGEALADLLARKAATAEIGEGPRLPALDRLIWDEWGLAEERFADMPRDQLPPDIGERCDDLLWRAACLASEAAEDGPPTTQQRHAQENDMRQADPFEGRARALAAAAGQDPDGRVENPAKPGKTMPAWTAFRSAAMAAVTAERQAEAAAGIVAMQAQPERYRGSPLTVFGDHEESTVTQMRNCMGVGNAVAGVICADGHLGYAQPVGGVIAYEGQISVSGVGFDIACGNMAVRLDTPFEAIREAVPAILADIRKAVSFGVGRANGERVEHPLLDDTEAWRASGMEDYRQKAAAQLGTVGSGNHYVDLMRDEAGMVWIGVHFGSRGLGHTSATRYLKLGGGKDGIHVPPTVLPEDSDLGRGYLAAMELAGRYAYAGREWVVERVRQIVGGAVTDMVHNHHNYAWREQHGGRDVWVVRKGATPAFPGQRGFVGGSMGDDAVIVEGVESETAASALYSTVHGAGRTFGRKEAKRRFTREQMDAWLRERGVMLSGGDLDESPMAYRRLPDVLAHHAGTVRVVHTLRPFAVAMAGDSDFDPFKD